MSSHVSKVILHTDQSITISITRYVGPRPAYSWYPEITLSAKLVYVGECVCMQEHIRMCGTVTMHVSPYSIHCKTLYSLSEQAFIGSAFIVNPVF